ncbi:GNAT family N-acetyltransferase [Streptomyces sp. NPDC048387]|uniref:GNAT family N-acetyltransferase n=1 Tax=Streptomyces sp. NPDC048387 TaxID=3365542 RepID=UPI0037133ACD
MPSNVTIRPARPEDGPALLTLQRAVWSPLSEPGPIPPPDANVFDERRPVSGYLVARHGRRTVGYIAQTAPTSLDSNRHVRQIRGLGVLGSVRGLGIGQALVEAACQAARAQGARRMVLCVLGHNLPARRLYERCGFTVSGVLPEHFLIDGAYVDDIWMSRPL